MRPLQTLLLLTERFLRGLRRRIRNRYYCCTLNAMGQGCEICDNVYITDPEYTYLGNRVTLNEGVILQALSEEASITIGNLVTVAYGAVILTGGLDLSNGIDHDKHATAPVVIEDSVWVGARAIILPGVTVGFGSAVAAGSIVTRDVEPNTLVAGIPAKPIRNLKSKNDL